MKNKPKTKKELRYHKEALADIEQCLQEVKREAKEDKKKKKLDPQTFDPINAAIENEQKLLEKDKERVAGLSVEEFAAWLMTRHDSFVETINWMFHCDFLSCQDYDDRMLKIMYINELNNLFFIYEIEDIEDEVIQILDDKNYVDLLNILNVLNFC